MGDVGFSDAFQHGLNFLLSCLLGDLRLLGIQSLSVGYNRFGELFRVVFELFLILVEILLQLFVGMFVGNQLEHHFDLIIRAATRVELDKYFEVRLFSLVLRVRASHR